MDVEAVFREGLQILDPVLKQHGFTFEEGTSGHGSGGDFVSGMYVRGNRKLELHLRYSLGLVTYHFGSAAVSHQDYMSAVPGAVGNNKYPGY